MNARVRARLAAILTALAFAIASAPSAFAADGEIGDMGDTNSIGNIFVDGNGHAAVKIDYPHDCPPQLACTIEVMFEYKCPEIWCFGWGNQGWKALPNPVNGVSTVTANCNGGQDLDNYWQVKYRVHWWAQQVRTVELWGELEAYVQANGTIGYRTIAEAGFNVSANGGFRGGTKIETTTAAADYGPEVYVATSGGIVLHTC